MKKLTSLEDHLDRESSCHNCDTARSQPSQPDGKRRKSSLKQILDIGSLPRMYGSLDATLESKKGKKSSIDHDIEQLRNQVPPTAVSDIIGSFGLFQFLVLLFSGLRETTVGYDAVVVSIISQPENRFSCSNHIANQSEIYRQSITLASNETLPKSNSTNMITNETFQCYQSLNGEILLNSAGYPIQCDTWRFPHHKYGASLISEWSLVCHRHWLVAVIESAFFLGLVVGNLVWGFTADRIGRRRAYLMSHTISLVAGLLSLIAPNIWTFTVARFFCAFGSIGYNIIYSIQIELIGTKHRAFSTILNHLGWGAGVILVPLVDHTFTDYHPIIALGPMITLLMFPLAFWLPESSRWLLANERYEEARQVLLRIARFNGRQNTTELNKKISLLEVRTKYDKMLSESRGDGLGVRSFAEVRKIVFGNPVLLRDTMVLSLVAFAGHLFYYLLTINFGYVRNLSTEVNFIISGAGEWVSVVAGAVLLNFLSRKTCMTLFLFLMATSFIFQTLIDAEVAPSLDTEIIVSTNNAIGTLSALLLVFITLIVNQEIYPTIVRQTGSSFVNTVGEIGSTLAPLVIQFGLLIGTWRANLLYAAFCLLTMIGTRYITKTDDIELLDN